MRSSWRRKNPSPSPLFFSPPFSFSWKTVRRRISLLFILLPFFLFSFSLLLSLTAGRAPHRISPLFSFSFLFPPLFSSFRGKLRGEKRVRPFFFFFFPSFPLRLKRAARPSLPPPFFFFPFFSFFKPVGRKTGGAVLSSLPFFS